MYLAMFAKATGLLGDAVTFFGAYRLARAEAGEADRVGQVEGMLKAFQETPDLQELPMQIGGRVVRGPKDVAIAIAEVFSLAARQGSWLLMAGFGLLLISRILEILGSGK